MSQIPAFLRGLAALIRSLVEQGRAVHVTAKTADELDLLAGLPWEECPATCADIALGWLRASRSLWFPTPVTYPAECIHVSRAEILRAAECAELAVIAGMFCFGTDASRHDVAAAYLGSIEGARAAWSFVADFVELALKTELVAGKNWSALLDTYRRELEAMK